MLIQHAMQSGPLINSKPAYFKRTDYIYIKRSYEFLSYIHKIGELGFTDTQKKRLENIRLVCIYLLYRWIILKKIFLIEFFYLHGIIKKKF